jgi:hypothetical protein
MFIANEDRAMELKLSGLVVYDVNSPDTGRPVQLIWLDNDTELTKLTYPAIIISNHGITYDAERAHSGLVNLTYTPEGFPTYDPTTTANPYWCYAPIPFMINYQIEVVAENNKHSTFLQAVLSGPDYLSRRFGYLEIPEDGTIRRLELAAGPDMQSTRDGDGKRLFHSVYAVQVATELLPKQIVQYQQVQTVHNDISFLPINDES